MGRISRGFRLLGASWQVLKADKELMVLPVISFLATAVVAATFIGGVFTLGVPEGRGFTPAQWVLMGLFYFFAYAIGIFFNAAVVGAATIRLQGEDPTIKDGLRLAYSKLDKIVGWAAIAASVGLILRALEERAGIFGRIAIALVGVAWSAVTFFVVPVLLYEESGVIDSVKRSGSIFKERWGEQFTGNVSIGLAVGLMSLPVAFAGFLVMQISIVAGIVVFVLGVGALSAAGAAMSGIFNAALYRFAVSGEAGGYFSEGDLTGAFAPRRQRRFM